MSGEDASATGQTEEEVNMMVQTLLQQMQTRFEQMSEVILGRIDEMGARVEDLERSMAGLMEQAQRASPNTPPPSTTQRSTEQ